MPSQRGFSFFLVFSLSNFPAESVDSQLLFPSPPPLCSREERKVQKEQEAASTVIRGCPRRGHILPLCVAPALSSVSWDHGAATRRYQLMWWQMCTLPGPLKSKSLPALSSHRGIPSWIISVREYHTKNTPKSLRCQRFGGEPFYSECVLSGNPVGLIYIFCFTLFQSSNSLWTLSYPF